VQTDRSLGRTREPAACGVILLEALAGIAASRELASLFLGQTWTQVEAGRVSQLPGRLRWPEPQAQTHAETAQRKGKEAGDVLTAELGRTWS
jgi:hypothetical protein